jgi:hypothetical protein
MTVHIHTFAHLSSSFSFFKMQKQNTKHTKHETRDHMQAHRQTTQDTQRKAMPTMQNTAQRQITMAVLSVAAVTDLVG